MNELTAVEIHRAGRFMAKVGEFIDSSLFDVRWSPRTSPRPTFGLTLEQAQVHATLALALVVGDMTEPNPRRLAEPAYELLEWCFDEVEETLCPGSVMTRARWERPVREPWSPFTGPTIGTMVCEEQRQAARARRLGTVPGLGEGRLLPWPDRVVEIADRLALDPAVAPIYATYLCTPQGTSSTLDT